MRCPYGICDGSGYVIDERTRTAAECRCMPEQRAQRMAGQLRARIPREYRDASFEHSNISGLPKAAVRDVRQYVDALPERLEAGDGLWISGGVGTGKTWLAMLVARYAIERGSAVAVYSVPRRLSEIRRTYDGEGLSTLDLLDQLTTVSLLVLDDVGTERSNPWVLEQLYTIINERWQEQRSIVLTTNLDLDAMQEQIGERTVSRLVGMCHTIIADNPEQIDHRTARQRIDVGRTQFDAAPPAQGPRFTEPQHGGGAGFAPGVPNDGGAGFGPGSRDDDGAPRSHGGLGPPPPLDPNAPPHYAEPPRHDDRVRDDQPPRYEPPSGQAHPSSAAIPPTWGVDPGGAHRPVRRGQDGH